MIQPITLCRSQRQGAIEDRIEIRSWAWILVHRTYENLNSAYLLTWELHKFATWHVRESGPYASSYNSYEQTVGLPVAWLDYKLVLLQCPGRGSDSGPPASIASSWPRCPTPLTTRPWRLNSRPPASIVSSWPRCPTPLTTRPWWLNSRPPASIASSWPRGPTPLTTRPWRLNSRPPASIASSWPRCPTPLTTRPWRR